MGKTASRLPDTYEYTPPLMSSGVEMDPYNTIENKSLATHCRLSDVRSWFVLVVSYMRAHLHLNEVYGFHLFL